MRYRLCTVYRKLQWFCCNKNSAQIVKISPFTCVSCNSNNSQNFELVNKLDKDQISNKNYPVNRIKNEGYTQILYCDIILYNMLYDVIIAL